MGENSELSTTNSNSTDTAEIKKAANCQSSKWYQFPLVISLIAIAVFSAGYALHIKYDLRFEFFTSVISSPYVREPIAMFLYLGIWMAFCITIIISLFLPVKWFWFWQSFVIFCMSLSASLILTKHSFGELSVSNVAHWLISYMILSAVIIVPVPFVIYISKKRKGDK